jgi:hypothetical protein
MHKLKNNVGRVIITINMWTSNYQKRGSRSLQLTSLMMNENYKVIYWGKIYLICVVSSFCNYLLCIFIILFWFRLIYVSCPHTQKVLAKVLLESFMDWNVDINLSTITLDNFSTNDALLFDFKDKL